MARLESTTPWIPSQTRICRTLNPNCMKIWAKILRYIVYHSDSKYEQKFILGWRYSAFYCKGSIPSPLVALEHAQKLVNCPWTIFDLAFLWATPRDPKMTPKDPKMTLKIKNLPISKEICLLG